MPKDEGIKFSDLLAGVVVILGLLNVITILLFDNPWSAYPQSEFEARLKNRISLSELKGPKLDRTLTDFKKSWDPEKQELAFIVEMELANEGVMAAAQKLDVATNVATRRFIAIEERLNNLSKELVDISRQQ